MKKILTIIALLTVPSLARIGETPAQCQARYGEPVNVDKENREITYTKAGMIILAKFWNGTAHLLTIAKQESDVLDRSKKMSAEEIQMLLKANSGGEKFATDKDSTPFKNMWTTPGTSRIATYSTMEHYLVIMTGDYALHVHKKNTAEEKENLKGF